MTLDAGNLFFDRDEIEAKQLELKQETARLIVDIYNNLKYDAYNVGGHDFALGLDFLKELQAKARFTFISANVVDTLTGKPVFEPYKIVKVGNKNFGIIGVTSVWNEKYRGVGIADPIQTLNKYLPALRKKADYIIVLAALTAGDENKLGAIKEKIDFILMAGSYRYSRNLEVVDGRFIARCGTTGKYVGIITAEINQPKKPLQDISNISVQLESATNRLKSFKTNAGDKSIEEYYADKPTQLKVIRDLQETQDKLFQQKSQIVNPVNYELIELDEKIEDDPAIRKKLNDFERRMNAKGYKITPAGD
ncbi:MAG TPA: hypothetical protein PKV04_08465 [Candidatus Marinimicrobia bacterium]|nr:hypothetical protein [Candidatus Neomarinimicrobiota bacterium]